MFVLIDTLATKQRQKPVYFRQMTGIGPRYTEDKGEAERFNTRQEATQCPAYLHPLCFFEPLELVPEALDYVEGEE